MKAIEQQDSPVKYCGERKRPHNASKSRSNSKEKKRNSQSPARRGGSKPSRRDSQPQPQFVEFYTEVFSWGSDLNG